MATRPTARVILRRVVAYAVLVAGDATSFFAPDGSRTVVGKPIQLFMPDSGTMLIDAGRALFDADGNLVSVNGPHPSLDADLAKYYCPS